MARAKQVSEEVEFVAFAVYWVNAITDERTSRHFEGVLDKNTTPIKWSKLMTEKLINKELTPKDERWIVRSVRVISHDKIKVQDGKSSRGGLRKLGKGIRPPDGKTLATWLRWDSGPNNILWAAT